jgi:hypothetical protein
MNEPSSMHFALRGKHYGPIWSVFFPEPDVEAIKKEFYGSKLSEVSNVLYLLHEITTHIINTILILQKESCQELVSFGDSDDREDDDSSDVTYRFDGFGTREWTLRSVFNNPIMELVYTVTIAGNERYFY